MADLDYLLDTQALTYTLLTSGYYRVSAHSYRDRVPPDSSAEGIKVAVDLREDHEVELRGLEPLAACMPCLTNPSGIAEMPGSRATRGAAAAERGMTPPGRSPAAARLRQHREHAGYLCRLHTSCCQQPTGGESSPAGTWRPKLGR